MHKGGNFEGVNIYTWRTLEMWRMFDLLRMELWIWICFK